VVIKFFCIYNIFVHCHRSEKKFQRRRRKKQQREGKLRKRSGILRRLDKQLPKGLRCNNKLEIELSSWLL
jgi:hypothetical protein